MNEFILVAEIVINQQNEIEMLKRERDNLLASHEIVNRAFENRIERDLKIIADVRAERDEAYERAAQVCEDEKNGCIDRFECADDIRALKDKP